MNLSYNPPVGWRFPTMQELAAPEKNAIRIGPFGSALKKREYSDSGVRVLGIEDVIPNELASDNRKYIPHQKFLELSQYIVKSDDLLVTNMGTVGRTCVVPTDLEKSIISSHLIKVTLNTNAANPRFVSWMLNFCPLVLAQIKAKSQGAIMAGFNSTLLKQLHIPLPPLAEQHRIVDILDRAEALRAKRRSALAQLNTLSQSMFADLFGDHATILSRWPIGKLGEILDFLTSGSRGWAAHYSESGSLFLRIQNVGDDELLLDDVAYVAPPDTAEAKRTRVQPGDVLLSITADLGRTAVVPDGIGTAFINQHLSILRTKALVPRFLSAYIASPVGQHQVSGRNRHGVKAGLNFDDIRSFVVPLPPFEMQREFARRVAAAEKLTAAQRAFQAELDSLFAVLQDRAFRGEL